MLPSHHLPYWRLEMSKALDKSKEEKAKEAAQKDAQASDAPTGDSTAKPAGKESFASESADVDIQASDDSFQEEIKRLEKELADARAKLLATQPEMKMPDEKLVEFRFQHIESPGTALDFVFGGQFRRFEDGKTYTAPVSVVKHLNSRIVPLHETELDQTTGQLKTVVVGAQNRFSCIPLDNF